MKKVRDTDARCLDHNELTQLRVRAVKAVQGAQAAADVAPAFGVNRTTVYGGVPNPVKTLGWISCGWFSVSMSKGYVKTV